jgi:hypothetical protein
MIYAGKYKSYGFRPRDVAWTPEVKFPHVRDAGPRPPSLNGGVDTGAGAKTPAPLYSGVAMLGIATLHKSNAVPVFTAAEAKDISGMRR